MPPHHLDTFKAQLADVRTVGQDASSRDMYGLMDQLTAYVANSVPSVACRAGCIACCSSELPGVSSLEWQVIHRHLLGLPAATQARLVAAADHLRPLAPVLQRHRQQKLSDSPNLGATPTLQCPFLLDGGCSIYAVRPLICRGYGYFGATLGEQTGFFGCLLASAHLKQVAGPGLDLPLFDPYRDRLDALNAAVGPATWAYLPQWLWAHIADGTLVGEASWAPDFGPAATAPPPRRRLPPNPRLRRTP